MRPSIVGALLLGMVLLQAVAAGKRGSCPNIKPKCMPDVKDKCRSDKECPKDQKCCNICGYSCWDPVPAVKEGKCPAVKAGGPCLSKKGDGCKDDSVCPGDQKCCNTGFGKQCTSPEDKSTKPGICKFYETFAPCFTEERTCQNDAQCKGKQKCCNVHCTWQCDDPQ